MSYEESWYLKIKEKLIRERQIKTKMSKYEKKPTLKSSFLITVLIGLVLVSILWLGSMQIKGIEGVVLTSFSCFSFTFGCLIIIGESKNRSLKSKHCPLGHSVMVINE